MRQQMQAQMEAMMEMAKAARVVALKGVGDEAYYFPQQASLVVRQGRHTFAITGASSIEPGALEDVQPLVERVARRVAKQL
jgi:hypothetical protein